MPMLINDQDTERRMIARRRRLGLDKFDEVWNGVYVMSPMANDEHQDVVSLLNTLLCQVIQLSGQGKVRPGVNVSNRRVDWKKNYRCPDVAVFLNGTTAENRGAYWLGGPDLAIEVTSPKERLSKKRKFYAKVGTRELLVVNREPWSLELYRLANGELTLVNQTTVASGVWLDSEVVPLAFRLIDGVERPRIEVRHADGTQTWFA